MASKLEKEGLRHLKNIEEDIEELKQRTANPKRSFLIGILWGAGTVFGTILAFALIGWGLSFFGFIPGFTEMAEYIRSLVGQARR
jgi:hypothetical protein